MEADIDHREYRVTSPAIYIMCGHAGNVLNENYLRISVSLRIDSSLIIQINPSKLRSHSSPRQSNPLHHFLPLLCPAPAGSSTCSPRSVVYWLALNLSRDVSLKIAEIEG